MDLFSTEEGRLITDILYGIFTVFSTMMFVFVIIAYNKILNTVHKIFEFLKSDDVYYSELELKLKQHTEETNAVRELAKELLNQNYVKKDSDDKDLNNSVDDIYNNLKENK